MREQLWRYYPQLLAATSDEVAAPWALDLWRRLPTPVAAQRVREATLAKLLQQHRIRRVDAATLRERLRGAGRPGRARCRRGRRRACAAPRRTPRADQPATRSRAPPSSTDWCTSSPRPHRRTTRTRPPRPRQRRPHRCPTRPSCARCPASAPASSLRCWPRVTTRCGGGDYDALRCLCGVAPVTRRSGKSLLVVRRLAAHDRLRDAAYHWARVAAHRDPVSRAKYQALRSRGHGHARSLRSVADRLLNVACAMLRDGTCFDPHRAGHVTA